MNSDLLKTSSGVDGLCCLMFLLMTDNTFAGCQTLELIGSSKATLSPKEGTNASRAAITKSASQLYLVSMLVLLNTISTIECSKATVHVNYPCRDTFLRLRFSLRKLNAPHTYSAISRAGMFCISKIFTEWKASSTAFRVKVHQYWSFPCILC
jgi:hypothetical protein